MKMLNLIQMRILICSLLGLLFLATSHNTFAATELSDAQIRQQIIQQSIRSYSGACPCPDNRMRNGRRCGGNSAYSRPGGASSLCYPQDVTQQMVEDYRRRSRNLGR